jgi:hypothetical protein
MMNHHIGQVGSDSKRVEVININERKYSEFFNWEQNKVLEDN